MNIRETRHDERTGEVRRLRRITGRTVGGTLFVWLNLGDEAALDNDALVRRTGLARDDPGDVLECQALFGRDERRGRNYDHGDCDCEGHNDQDEGEEDSNDEFHSPRGLAKRRRAENRPNSGRVGRPQTRTRSRSISARGPSASRSSSRGIPRFSESTGIVRWKFSNIGHLRRNRVQDSLAFPRSLRQFRCDPELGSHSGAQGNSGASDRPSSCGDGARPSSGHCDQNSTLGRILRICRSIDGG